MSTRLLAGIPERISEAEVLTMLRTKDINWSYVQLVKEYTQLKDDLLSEWLNISVKTFRSYKKENAALKENMKEQVLMLLSLFKHGQAVFGSRDIFHQWLVASNFYLDGEAPIGYLNTISGIRFVDDRLTAMEFGDNV